MSPVFNEYYVKRSGMKDFLDSLDVDSGLIGFSACLPPGLSVDEIDGMAIPGLLSEISAAVSGSPTGGVIFLGSGKNRLVLPPFPVDEKVIFTGYVTEPLRNLLAKDLIIGLVLVHLGTYAVGICKGDGLVSSKVGTGLVHGRTRKGGSSSQRFHRRRENQATEFLERVCGHAREHLQPYERAIDYLVYGGPRQTVLRLRKECPFLHSFDDKVLSVIDVPALKQKVLEAAVTRLWSSRIIEWET